MSQSDKGGRTPLGSPPPFKRTASNAGFCVKCYLLEIVSRITSRLSLATATEYQCETAFQRPVGSAPRSADRRSACASTVREVSRSGAKSPSTARIKANLPAVRGGEQGGGSKPLGLRHTSSIKRKQDIPNWCVLFPFLLYSSERKRGRPAYNIHSPRGQKDSLSKEKPSRHYGLMTSALGRKWVRDCVPARVEGRVAPRSRVQGLVVPAGGPGAA